MLTPHLVPPGCLKPPTLGPAAAELLPFPAENFGVEWEFLAVETSLFTLGLSLSKPSSCHCPTSTSQCQSGFIQGWDLLFFSLEGVWHLGGCEISIPLGNNRAEGRRQLV